MFFNNLFLKLVMLFSGLLDRAGVDTLQLYEILKVKLLIDNRRPRTLFTARKRNPSTTGTGSSNPWMVSFFTVLMGFFIGMLLFFRQMPLTGQTFYFTIFMVLIAFTLVSDFTTVLIDTRDQFILLPRPVNDRTIAVARILHITIYVLRLALLQGLPGIVMAGFADHSFLSPFLFLIQILQATFLAILLVNLIYLGMMRSMNPQRFKDVISYFQIAFSTLIFATYYLLPRLIDISSLEHINLLAHWWAYVLPPVWIAAVNQVLIFPGQAALVSYGLAALGFFMPLAGLWFVVKVLAPGFNKKLAVLATSEGNPVSQVKKTYKLDLRDKIANLLSPDPIENAGFRVTWKLAARSREFKMKAYPSFAFVPVMFFYYALSGHRGAPLSQKMAGIQHGSGYLILAYLSTIVLTSFISNISMSEKYRSSWVYYALPIDQPGKILTGMYKAVAGLFYFPFYLMLSIAIAVIWGPQVINDLILAFLINLMYGILIALFTVKGLPFSKPVIAQQAGGRAVTNLVILSFIGLLGYGHYFLSRWETVIWLLIIPAAAFTWLMFYYYRRQTWEAIELSEV